MKILASAITKHYRRETATQQSVSKLIVELTSDAPREGILRGEPAI